MLLTLSPALTNAQVNGYGFTPTTGEVMETGAFTTLLGTFIDDGVSPVTSIGFNFVYGGVTYTNFSASSNGLFYFGGSSVSTYSNNLVGLTGPYLMPYWDDNYTDADGNVQYMLTGAPGSQKLVVEYNLSYLGTTGTADKHFQVWIYENSTDVRFVYGVGNDINAQFTVGIMTSPSDYICVTVPTNTASTVAVNNANTVWPGMGNGYLFSNCAPVSIVPDLMSLPDVTNECSVAMPTAPTATNDCGGTYNGTTGVVFPVTAQGTTIVTWTYDDGMGNITTQDQNVIIADITIPVPDAISLDDTTNNCSIASIPAPTATDNCMGSIVGTPDLTFPITNSGLNVLTWTFDDGNGNVTTQTQNVTIITPDVTVSQVGIVLTSNATGATYQWLDCDNAMAQIAGETGQTYTPTITGNYAVAVTKNGCTDTSACSLADFTGLGENEIVFKAYPNPTTGILLISASNVSNDNVVKITNSLGQFVMSFQLTKNQMEVDLSQFGNGIYFIEISDENTSSVQRIIKN